MVSGIQVFGILFGLVFFAYLTFFKLSTPVSLLSGSSWAGKPYGQSLL